jgi:multimeric flavodoxin WrbA
MSLTQKLVIGLNGSPRKDWNTDKLVSEALKGAAELGAVTKNFDLYQLYFRGCASCFSCKTKANYLSGICAIKDELSPILELLRKATGVVLGSPLYLWDVTGAVRNFIERYGFTHLEYNSETPSILEKGPTVGLIYTMGAPEEYVKTLGADFVFKNLAKLFRDRFKAPNVYELMCSDTKQFADYSRYQAPVFNPEHKIQNHEEKFPKKLKEALEIGRRLGAVEDLPVYRSK